MHVHNSSVYTELIPAISTNWYESMALLTAFNWRQVKCKNLSFCQVHRSQLKSRLIHNEKQYYTQRFEQTSLNITHSYKAFP